MSRDPGDIPQTGVGNLVQALSIARDLPDLAIARATLTPGLIEPAVVRVVEQAAGGAELDERAGNLLFWGIHVLGAARRQALYRPLLRLLQLPGDKLEDLLGPALSGSLPKLLIGAFDGDLAPLQAAILSPGTDELARNALFRALAYLAWAGRIEAGAARALLVRFDEERPAPAGQAGWDGWEAAIALLGFRDLAPRVSAAHADARLLGDPNLFELSESDFADPARFEADDLGYIEDTIEELAGLLLGDEEDEEADPEEPVRNPLRDVGRNDPCPCGSGRKFKKCCLGSG